MSLADNEKTLEKITTCRIHPGIGIARIGNSPDEFFIGPEYSDQQPTDFFRDKEEKVKRQAARFRIYGYDDKGKVVKELTFDDAEISWDVHIANKKAANQQFENAYAPRDQLELRNKDVIDRHKLVNNPGRHFIKGLSKSGDKYQFNGICFETKVSLGEIRTDEKGHLLVLGGFGKSNYPKGDKITSYANKNGWYDDTSDGPVNAEVVLKSGRKIPVTDSAWVIVAPPKFAPYHYPIITLYDVMQEVTLVKSGKSLPKKYLLLVMCMKKKF